MGMAQPKPETIAITLQGKGPCTTRSFAVQDNWHIESTSDSPIRVDAMPTDGSPLTTLVNSPAAIPPPPSYTAVSAPVAKGGNYSLAITATGTWQITMIENGFTKSLSAGGNQPTSPAVAANPSPSLVTSGPGGPFLMKNQVAAFRGNGDQNSTQSFTISAGWEIRWYTYAPIKITLKPTDGSPSVVIANMSQEDIENQPHYAAISSHGDMPVAFGKSIQSMGGTFTFQVETSNRWNVSVFQTDSSTIQAGVSTQPGTSPVPSATPATPTTPAPIVKLTDDQTRAVVLIKGDNGEGTGFLVKMPEGPVVVTNIHVIANNPNLKITTNTGAVIPMISVKGASDRDLALLSIKDAGYSYLTICPDISKTAQNGDEVVTPGNSLGGEVMLNTGGKVLGIGPQKIEIDNPIYHGNSGGPIFHTKSNQVLGVVTEGMKVDTSDQLDKTSFASRNSAISGGMRYFGMRLDNVPSWIPIDWGRFQNEALFLQQFHDQSTRLDAYLNAPESDTSALAMSYKKDDKIMRAIDTYRQNVDTDGKVSAGKAWIFDLQGIVDKDMDQIQNMNNFYSFDQEQAQEEMEYRKALKRELDSIGDDIGRLKGHQSSN